MRSRNRRPFFLTRIKSNTCYRRLYSRPVDKSLGLRCDQTIVLTGFYARRDYPDKLRLIKYVDPEAGKALRFMTNNFIVPAMTVAELYRCRWQVELFFRWIKQHLRIKAFFGTSENAVKTQIWIAPETAWQELENYLAVRKACPREEENHYLAFERKNTECFHFNGIDKLAT